MPHSLSMTPRRCFAALAVVCYCLLLQTVVQAPAGPASETLAAASSTAALESDPTAANNMLAAMPSPFVPNLGQWDHPARFVQRSGSMSVLLEDRGWTLGLVERPAVDEDRQRPGQRPWMRKPKSEPGRGVALRMTFEGDLRLPKLEGEGVLPGVHNYFLGNDDSMASGVRTGP